MLHEFEHGIHNPNRLFLFSRCEDEGSVFSGRMGRSETRSLQIFSFDELLYEIDMDIALGLFFEEVDEIRDVRVVQVRKNPGLAPE